MLIDWLKQNIIATITGAVVASATISGATVYVVVADRTIATVNTGVQQPSALATEPEVFPAKFIVEVSGTWRHSQPRSAPEPETRPDTTSFLCDLTVQAEKICQSHSISASVIGSRIVIKQHAHDATRVAIQALTLEERTGITWKQLSEGIQVNGYKLVARLPKRTAAN